MRQHLGENAAGGHRRATVMSTAAVAPGEAFSFWQDLICDTFVQLSAAPTRQEPFQGRVTHSGVGPVGLTRVRASGQSVRRTARLIARSSEEYVLASIQLAGRGEVRQDGRVAHLVPGAMAFYDSTRPYELYFADSFEQLVVQVPLSALSTAALGRATGVALGAQGTGRLVADFFRGLARQAASDAAGCTGLAPHALGLLMAAMALAGGTRSEQSEVAVERQRVHSYLVQHSRDPGLSADAVAAGCHLSRRALFRLFEGEPDGFADVLRRLRVGAAQTLLRAEPRMPLVAVAAHSGFAGEAQLHRAFRALTGTTPAAYRRQGVS